MFLKVRPNQDVSVFELGNNNLDEGRFMCQIDENREPKNPAGSPAESPTGPRMIDSVSLLQGAREIYIRHRGEVYRLMETRNGKLILQK